MNWRPLSPRETRQSRNRGIYALQLPPTVFETLHSDYQNPSVHIFPDSPGDGTLRPGEIDTCQAPVVGFGANLIPVCVANNMPPLPRNRDEYGTQFSPLAPDPESDSKASCQSSTSNAVFSEEGSPLELGTPTTFELHQRRSDAPSSEDSDDEDTMSDMTDYTDNSLVDAFEAFDPALTTALLPLLISIKEKAVERLISRIQASVSFSTALANTRQEPAGEASSGGSHSVSDGAGSRSFLPAEPFGRKRGACDSSGQRNGDREEDDDDGEVRKWQQPTMSFLQKVSGRFACPFYKMYPESESLTKSCKGPGWDSVHRVKSV